MCDDKQRLDYNLVMNTAMLAGEWMLRSGAETYRVEDTILHILRTANAQSVEVSVMMTGIVATIADEGMQPITVIKRVQSRGTHMDRVIEVNEISRQYCRGELALEDAYQRLKSISGKQYRVGIYNMATIFVAVGFVPLFGGMGQELVATFFVGAILALIMTIGKGLQINGFMLNVLSSMGIAVGAIGMRVLMPSVDVNVVIVSAIMPLVPGVAITNAIRDTLQGDYLSGVARIMEAFLTAAAIAVGVGVGLSLLGIFYQGGGFL